MTPSPRRSRRGAAAVELALCLPVVVGAFAGIIELSELMSQMHVLSRAARDAARVGSMTIEGVDADGTAICDAAEQQAATVLAAAGLPCEEGCTVEAVWALDEAVGYRFVTVTIRYPYEPFTAVLPELSQQITTRFAMMTQQQ